MLNLGQAAARPPDIQAFSVPTDERRDQGVGPEPGLRGQRRPRPTTPACDCITDAATGDGLDRRQRRGALRRRRRATRLPQGWQVNVGLGNFTRAFTDSVGLRAVPRHPRLELRVRHPHRSSRRSSLGLLVAIALNSPRLRGAAASTGCCIVLPYAMPSFAMLLVWRDMFNTDFGLINNLTGLDVNWFGERLDRPVRRPADPVLARLPVHVPGLPRARSSRSRRT